MGYKWDTKPWPYRPSCEQRNVQGLMGHCSSESHSNTAFVDLLSWDQPFLPTYYRRRGDGTNLSLPHTIGDVVTIAEMAKIRKKLDAKIAKVEGNPAQVKSFPRDRFCCHFLRTTHMLPDMLPSPFELASTYTGYTV